MFNALIHYSNRVTFIKDGKNIFFVTVRLRKVKKKIVSKDFSNEENCRKINHIKKKNTEPNVFFIVF